ncbi:hypothetical protein O4158_22675 [Gordonia amicalis]|uniref:lipopolysaccharide biosynthesis protein n=1 Tax=Gordonia amicalis TaxID=89053 RepID=UPI0022B44516|nr:hypothetical protein [Gordonia amicalis]MCZ4581839.1 hypothetical protein [Gordonia amicalis]
MSVGTAHRDLGKVRSLSRYAKNGLDPRQVLPLCAAVGGRLSQLGILLVLASIPNTADRDAVIIGFAVISAAGMLTDSGAANYLLTRQRELIDRRIYLTSLLTQLGFAVVGGIVSLAYCSWLVETSATGVLIIALLSISQISDSVGRVARSYFLVIGQPLKFAAPEFMTMGGRLGGVAVFAMSPVAEAWVIPAVISTAVASWVSWTCYRRLPAAVIGSRPTVRRIVSFGLSGATSVLYSQAPLLVAPVVLSNQAAAYFAFVVRLVQPLEIVPATFSMQLLPRLGSPAWRRTSLTWRIWLAFLGMGAVAIGLLLCGVPILTTMFSAFNSDHRVILLLALGVLFKFGNYGLVAVLLSRQLSTIRTYCNLLVATVFVPMFIVGAAEFGLHGLALTMSVGEIFLTCALAVSLRLGLSRRYA